MDSLIKGKQVILRDAKFADLEAMAYWLNPSHEWHQFNGPYYAPTPADEIPELIGRWAERIAKADYPVPRFRFVIAHKDTDEIIGTVTRYWISAETNWTAIGISIWNPENWKNGYGYEAFGLWCEYLFAVEPKFVRLDARTWSGNTGMIKLAKKLGFQREAVFRMARVVNGEYYDGLGYGILREEWENKYPDGFAASF